MFNEKDITEFVKRIIEKEPDGTKAIFLIEEFRKNLQLTKMASNASIERVDNIIECLISSYNLNKLLNNEKISNLVKTKTYENRHYNNYHTTSSSSSCGGSSSGYSTSCGEDTTTYSSRC